jgi:uncharacterized protein
MNGLCGTLIAPSIINRDMSDIDTMDAMQINVSQLLKEAVGSERNYEVSGTIDISDNGIGSTVQGNVRLTRTNRSILVKGKLYLTVEVACARCLNPFACPLVLDIEEEYFPILDTTSGAPLPSPDEPSSFTIDEHQVLDLTEAARQYAVMALPMKPLCRKDCPGLQAKP